MNLKTTGAVVNVLRLFGFIVLTCGSVQAAHYDIFLLAGQSNMDGRGAKADLKGELEKWAKPQPEVLISFRAGGLHRTLTSSGGFKPLEPGYSGNKHVPGDQFGPEVSFGATLAEALPGRKVALIKCAEGGTSLAKDWAPDEKGKLYDQFITFTRQTCKELEENGDTYTLRGMIWHQGESDANLPPGKYQELLTGLIDHVRADFKIKDLPFVIGEVFDNGKRDAVRKTQKGVAATVPNTGLASVDGLKTGKDQTHFTAESQIELGQRFARAMLPLCSETGAAAGKE